jgi:hypothetical protein
MSKLSILCLTIYLYSLSLCIRIKKQDLLTRLNTSALGGLSLETRNATAEGVSETGASSLFRGGNVTGRTALSGRSGLELEGLARGRTATAGESNLTARGNQTNLTHGIGAESELETAGGAGESATVTESGGSIETPEISAMTTSGGSTIIRMSGEGSGRSITAGGGEISATGGRQPARNVTESRRPAANETTRPQPTEKNRTREESGTARGRAISTGGGTISVTGGNRTSDANATRPNTTKPRGSNRTSSGSGIHGRNITNTTGENPQDFNIDVGQ